MSNKEVVCTVKDLCKSLSVSYCDALGSSVRSRVNRNKTEFSQRIIEKSVAYVKHYGLNEYLMANDSEIVWG